MKLVSSLGLVHVVGPSQPIMATVGDEVILPCQLEPATKASGLTVEWARPDLNPRFVYVWRDGVELESKTHPSYKRRTKVFPDEQKLGDVSLNLSKVKFSDGGTYKCFIPGHGDALIQLVVGAVNSPFIVSINISSSGVVLQCESEGWYPEPEVLWLDGEGNLLSAGPTETVRGPDDLYTVSSRVTVEKRHSNSFTCRVQQKNINQTRETHIHIAGSNMKGLKPPLPTPLTEKKQTFSYTYIFTSRGSVNVKFVLRLVLEESIKRNYCAQRGWLIHYNVSCSLAAIYKKINQAFSSIFR
uniref:Ig-like domain-containing protein n=1 Tax=Sander lucioperca TaxID=283035 RepID=A0A8C9XLZ5_SANLU